MLKLINNINNVLSLKFILFISFLTFILLLPFSILNAYSNSFYNYRTKNIINDPITIVIDAGHGGHDPGCNGTHTLEKNITLSIALKVGSILSQSEHSLNIIYTRTKDVFIPLYERIDIANNEKADLFISIHCNSSLHSTARGSESYVMGIHRSAENLQVAKRENMAILFEKSYNHNYENYNPYSPVGHIILSTFQNIYLEQSISIANRIEQMSPNDSKIQSRGVKQAGFVVLRNATMPSVLIETGFLTNPNDEKYLISEVGQLEIASSISKAIVAFVIDKTKNDILKLNNLQKENHASLKSVNILAQDYSKSSLKDNVRSDFITISTNENEKANLQKKKLLYRIQLASTKKNINTNSEKWTQIKDLLIIKKGKLFNYYTGKFTSKSKALDIKKHLRANGFKGAFVVHMSI